VIEVASPDGRQRRNNVKGMDHVPGFVYTANKAPSLPRRIPSDPSYIRGCRLRALRYTVSGTMASGGLGGIEGWDDKEGGVYVAAGRHGLQCIFRATIL
jgi:hypothetical protein